MSERSLSLLSNECHVATLMEIAQTFENSDENSEFNADEFADELSLYPQETQRGILQLLGDEKSLDAIIHSASENIASILIQARLSMIPSFLIIFSPKVQSVRTHN